MNGDWNMEAEVDIEEAIKRYKMAAEQGNTDAMVSLANTYFWSDDFHSFARPWYEKAAAEENAEAECMMGVLEDDPEVKADWFEKAALQEYAEAQYSLAQIYQKGNGRPKDYQKAMQLCEKAADQGDAMALRALGRQYDSGELLEQDDQKALEYFRKAADQDDTISKIEVGKYYYFGIGVGEDNAEAVKWFEQAISDDERSLAEDEMHSIGGECYRLLGECYLKGYGVEEDLDKAVELLETGSYLDDGHAQYLLGACYVGGLGVSQRAYNKAEENAFELFLASAQKENQDAIEEVIRCYRDGVGIAQDLVEAEDWHSKLEKPHGDEEKYERAVERQALQREVKTNNVPRTEIVLGGENIIPFPNQANREEVLDRIQERTQQHIPEPIAVKELIATDENARTELKSSARFDTQLNQRNDNLEGDG